MARWALAFMAWVCLLGATSCKQATEPTGDGDNRILALALTRTYGGDGYTVVHPVTELGPGHGHPSDSFSRRRQRVIEQLQIPEVDAASLVDAFIAKNRQSVRLSLPSAPEDGYLVDYDEEYDRYFETGGGGWDRLYAENPRVRGLTSVSLPLWDRESGVVLLYVGTLHDGRDGGGDLIAYQYDGQRLKTITRVNLWVN